MKSSVRCFSVLSQVQAELEAAGVSIDIGQLDWACRQVEQRLYEASLDEQYERERARDSRQRANDEAAEWEAIEARSRFAREGDVETPLGEQIEGE